MTDTCEYNGTLLDKEKVDDLLIRINNLASMIHQMYLDKSEDEIKLNNYNGDYTGNFAIRKDFLFVSPDDITSDIIKTSRDKYIKVLKKKNIDKTEDEIISLCEKFFDKYIFVDKINVKGVQFKHSTDPSDEFDDFKYFSTHSFIFMFTVNIGDYEIEKKNQNMVELYKIKDKKDELSPIDTMIFSPYFTYRHYSLHELFDLYYWMSTFYSMDDFEIDVMYSSYECNLFENYEELYFRDRNDVFKKVKKVFANKILDSRAMKDTFMDKDYNSESNNFEVINEKHKKALWKKYMTIIES